MAYPGGPLHSLVNTGQKVFVQSADGDVVLHVSGGVARNEAPVTIWNKSTHGQQANLQWTIETAPNGQFFLASAVDPAFVLHQSGGVHTNDGACSLWDKRTHGHQGNLQVTFEPRGNCFAIRFAHSGKYAHVHGGGTANDTKVTQWDWVEQNNLKWYIFPVDPIKALANTGRRVFVRSAVGDVVMHVSGGGAHNEAHITTWSRATHGHQANLQWTIETAPGGHFFLASAVDPAFVLHQSGGVHTNGGACSLWDKRTHGHQGNLQVTFEPHGDCFGIRFVHSGKYAHVQGGSSANDTPVSQWDWCEQANLKWRIFPVS